MNLPFLILHIGINLKVGPGREAGNVPTIHLCRVCIIYFMVVTLHYAWVFSNVFGFGHSYVKSLSNLLKIRPKGKNLQALSCHITLLRFRVITFDVQILYIGRINFTLKLVWTSFFKTTGLIRTGPNWSNWVHSIYGLVLDQLQLQLPDLEVKKLDWTGP